MTRTIALWGRPLKPVALCLTITMIIVTQANLRGVDRGTQPPLSYVVAAIAALAVIALVIGWIGRDPRAMRIGLLLVVAAYSTRAVFIALVSGPDQAVWFSLATVVLAAGSYALEVANDPRGSCGR